MLHRFTSTRLGNQDRRATKTIVIPDSLGLPRVVNRELLTGKRLIKFGFHNRDWVSGVIEPNKIDATVTVASRADLAFPIKTATDPEQLPEGPGSFLVAQHPCETSRGQNLRLSEDLASLRREMAEQLSGSHAGTSHLATPFRELGSEEPDHLHAARGHVGGALRTAGGGWFTSREREYRYELAAIRFEETAAIDGCFRAASNGPVSRVLKIGS